MKESRSTMVSFDPRKGVCFFRIDIARMHSFNASKEVLISAPSRLVRLSVVAVSAPRSEPAKSTSENLPKMTPLPVERRGLFSGSCRTVNVHTACDLDD